jgi:hypothetical protein
LTPLVVPTPIPNEDYEAALLDAINEVRVRAGVARLSRSTVLDEIARLFAERKPGRDLRRYGGSGSLIADEPELRIPAYVPSRRLPIRFELPDEFGPGFDLVAGGEPFPGLVLVAKSAAGEEASPTPTISP